MVNQNFKQAELAHVSRPIPGGLGVVPKSVPITAFGQFDSAKVATLSLNPSYLEFTNNKGEPLGEDKRRLFSRHDLGIDDTSELDSASAQKVIESFRNYFSDQANPYRKWFGPMEKRVLSSVGASYWNGSASHLDLSQWATNPIWNKLGHSNRDAILETDLPFLKQQIESKKFDLVLLNGMTVISEVSRIGLASLEIEKSQEVGGKRVVFYSGQALGTTFLGWNWYLQSAISDEVRDAVSIWLRGKS